MDDKNSKDFVGKLPYATELFGVYQPLLGWTGRQSRNRILKAELNLSKQVIQDIRNDLEIKVAL